MKENCCITITNSITLFRKNLTPGTHYCASNISEFCKFYKKTVETLRSSCGEIKTFKCAWNMSRDSASSVCTCKEAIDEADEDAIAEKLEDL